jgi:hypothetical protein
VDFVFDDFNGAAAYYDGAGAGEWSDLSRIVEGLPISLQASQQAGIGGRPIFDPKATNAFLNAEAARLGWRVIPVPAALKEFGTDWDGGKGGTLAEWQFSNYPFLWNNIIRSEAVYKGKVHLGGLGQIEGLVIVTKGGLFPSSNSTLYYEQAKAQVKAVTALGAFSIPIRLVGLTILQGTPTIDVMWSEYPERYCRDADRQTPKKMALRWGRVVIHAL